MKYKVNYNVPDAQVLYEEKKNFWMKMPKDKKEEEPIPPYKVPEPQGKVEIVNQLRAALDCLEEIYVEDDLFVKACARLAKKQVEIKAESVGLNELKEFKSDQKRKAPPKESNFLCANGFTILFSKETIAKNIRASYGAQFEEIFRKKQKKTSKAWKLGIGIVLLAYVAFFVSLFIISFLTDYKEYFTVPDFVSDIFKTIYQIGPLAGIIFVIVFALIRSKKANAEYQKGISEIEQTIIWQTNLECEKVDQEFADAVRQVDLQNQRIDKENVRIREENNRILQYNNEVMQRYLPENQRRAEVAWKRFMSYEAEKNKHRQERIDLHIKYLRDYSWIPKDYASIFVLRKIIKYFDNRLVDDLKEAFRYYEQNEKDDGFMKEMKKNAQDIMRNNENLYKQFERNQQANQKRNEEYQKRVMDQLQFMTENEMWQRMCDNYENRRNMFDAVEYARTGYRPMF